MSDSSDEDNEVVEYNSNHMYAWSLAITFVIALIVSAIYSARFSTLLATASITGGAEKALCRKINDISPELSPLEALLLWHQTNSFVQSQQSEPPNRTAQPCPLNSTPCCTPTWQRSPASSSSYQNEGEGSPRYTPPGVKAKMEFMTHHVANNAKKKNVFANYSKSNGKQ